MPLSDELAGALRKHMAAFRMRTYTGGRRSPWVFHHTRTRRKCVAGERIRSMREGFERARRRAKLPAGFVAHDLRHRRATLWIADGGNVVHVKEALGHSALQTTMRYTHLAKTHLRSLVEGKDSREALREVAR